MPVHLLSIGGIKHCSKVVPASVSAVCAWVHFSHYISWVNGCSLVKLIATNQYQVHTPHDTDDIEKVTGSKVTGSKVKVSRRWSYKSCKLDRSWLANHWRDLHPKIYTSLLRSGHERIKISRSWVQRSRSQKSCPAEANLATVRRWLLSSYFYEDFTNVDRFPWLFLLHLKETWTLYILS